MLLTITTNAVVTTTQNILSNVIVELRVVSACLHLFAAKAAKASRAKRRQWQAMQRHSMSYPQGHPCSLWRWSLRSDSRSSRLPRGGRVGAALAACGCCS